MNNAILFLHFFGLMLGAAGGFASAFIMRRALALPADEGEGVCGAFGPILVKMSATGEAVALEETEQGEWTLRFCAHPLGIIDPRTKKLGRPLPSSQGHANAPQQSTGKL